MGLAISTIWKVYSYVGDTFEFNFMETDTFVNHLPTQEIASEENILEHFKMVMTILKPKIYNGFTFL